MASGEIHVGDVGTAFRFVVKDEQGAVMDLSAASVLKIFFDKPSSAVLEKTATLVTDGTDGQIQYVTRAGDLSEPGTWKYQGYIVVPSGVWWTDIHKFKVYANLA